MVERQTLERRAILSAPPPARAPASPALHLGATWWRDGEGEPPAAEGWIDAASHLPFLDARGRARR